MFKKEVSFVSAVIYIHNSEDSIKKFLEILGNVFEEKFINHEIICVNDDSTDESVKEIHKFAENYKGGKITILNMSYYQGIENSMIAGMDLAIGDYVFEFDNTVLNYDLSLIEKLYKRCLEGYDIVTACPQKRKKEMSDLFYYVYNNASDTQYDLRTENFRIISRRAINRIKSMNTSLFYRKAVYSNCGLPMSVIEYNEIKEKCKKNKLVKKSQKNIAIDSLILYTDLAYKLAFSFSVFMIVITALCIIYTVYIFLIKQPVRGWTTTMFVMSFGFFCIGCLLTMLMKYVSLILKIIFKKHKYLIESIEKL